MNNGTPNFNEYKPVATPAKMPKLTAVPRMHYEPSWPIGNLRLSSDSVSMSLYHANYYLSHQDVLIEALGRVVRYADKMKHDSLYLERVQFANQIFHIYPGKWDTLQMPWHMSNKSADSLLVYGWDMLNRKDIGERHYVCMDIHEDLLQRANSEGQARLAKITREKKRLEKERAQIDKDREKLMKQQQEVERKLARLEAAEARLQARKEAQAVLQQQPRSTAGYVYLLKEINGPHYKIGHTSNPDNRAKTFKVTIPYQVQYIHLIETDDMKALESELHARYHHRRVDGEWFALTPSDVQSIKSL